MYSAGFNFMLTRLRLFYRIRKIFAYISVIIRNIILAQGKICGIDGCCQDYASFLLHILNFVLHLLENYFDPSDRRRINGLL